MVYYHVTLLKNWPSIKQNGLLPLISKRSEEMGESVPAVYLFTSRTSMNEALCQWLGDWYETEYGEEVKLCSLEVTLDQAFPLVSSEAAYEILSLSKIPPGMIKFLQEE